MIQRYNMYSAAAVNGAPAPGVSSGQAIAPMEDIAGARTRCRHAMQSEWTELALLQLQTGNTAMLRVRAGRGAGVPGAGRAVRELVAAAGRDPRRADVPALLDRRRARRAAGHQHLHPGRLRRAGRVWRARTRF